MKATLTLDQVRNFCVSCGETIPVERVKRNAVTCSKECGQAMERQRMLLMEQTECKYCRRPSTPEEREEFKRWRRWMKEQTAASASEAAYENAEETASEDAAKATEYPYLYTQRNSPRKGARCRKQIVGGVTTNSLRVQIQFEDGETLIAAATCLRRAKDKNALPSAETKSTLAPKRQIDEGE
jgi:hypothetical protein